MLSHLLKTTFFLLFFSCFCKAQVNLVPNFSFEQSDTCPNAGDQIQYSIGWGKYSAAVTTPDYYNACALAAGPGVPKNGAGYQSAHRYCSAFAGIVTFDVNNANYREHIGMQISFPLTIGQQYFVSFYTVMSEQLLGSNYFGMPSSNIGIRLSTIAYNGNTPAPIDNYAHLNRITILNDSINWTRVSGSFMADSAYRYLIIGNFFDDAHTDTLYYTCGTCQNSYSYYYIDDVCLSTDSVLCNGGVDLLPCNVSVNEIISDNSVLVFPMPTFDFINLYFKSNTTAKIILSDVSGNILFSETINNEKETKIDLSSIPSAIYFLKIIERQNPFPIIKKITKL